ncbi:MAG: hypothetical protein JKY65_07610 [Planctomycetes bacterium]|nr:hypothetical protein [Planctomycetota bacterium]
MTLQTALRHAPATLLLCLLAVPAFGQSLDSADYQKLDRAQKRNLLWKAITEGDPYDMEKLPTKGAITGALRLIWGKFSLRSTFDDDLDIRPKRFKVFHRWGTAVKVRWEVAQPGIVGGLLGTQPARHPYTGVFKDGTVGIARLSLGLGDVKKLWAPGIGVKLFVDGQPSVNILAIPRAGAQPTKNFMAPNLDTKIDPTPLDGFLKWAAKADPTHRKTDNVAAINAKGEAVANPKSPFRLEFRPGTSIQYSGTPHWGFEDFRVSLQRIPAGTVLYEVWAVSDDAHVKPVKIARLRTESAFAATKFQDRELHFKHVR